MPFLSRMGIEGTCMYLTFEESNPQYFLSFRKFSITCRLLLEQAKTRGKEIFYSSPTPKFFLIRWSINSNKVLLEFISRGYRNLFWCIKRLEEPAHKNKILTKVSCKQYFLFWRECSGQHPHSLSSWLDRYFSPSRCWMVLLLWGVVLFFREWIDGRAEISNFLQSPWNRYQQNVSHPKIRICDSQATSDRP